MLKRSSSSLAVQTWTASALVEGLLTHRMINPELVPDELFEDALRPLAKLGRK